MGDGCPLGVFGSRKDPVSRNRARIGGDDGVLFHQFFNLINNLPFDGQVFRGSLNHEVCPLDLTIIHRIGDVSAHLLRLIGPHLFSVNRLLDVALDSLFCALQGLLDDINKDKTGVG